jgi:arsenate reductase
MRENKTKKIKILFLCTGNSCRSQMAEGWTRHLYSIRVIEAHSAGIEAHGINPNAIQVMAEAGVDISGQCSKLVEEITKIKFDYVITLCDNANENCPVFPGKTQLKHFGFDDPPALAKFAKTQEEMLGHYRRVRDEIKSFVEKLPEIILKLKI